MYAAAIRCVLIVILAFVYSCVQKETAVGEKEETAGGPAAESVPVSNIFENRGEYDNTVVTVSGRVVTGMAFEFVDEQPYRLNDGSGEIWVITTGTVPAEGASITVTGEVMVPYQIKGRRYEAVILEQERR